MLRSSFGVASETTGQIKTICRSVSNPCGNTSYCGVLIGSSQCNKVNGEEGIRTLGTDKPYTAFPRLLLKPLGHLSKGKMNITSISRFGKVGDIFLETGEENLTESSCLWCRLRA